MDGTKIYDDFGLVPSLLLAKNQPSPPINARRNTV